MFQDFFFENLQFYMFQVKKGKLKKRPVKRFGKMKTPTEEMWSRDFAKVVEDMCCQSLQYNKEIRVEGVLAITLDNNKVVASASSI